MRRTLLLSLVLPLTLLTTRAAAQTCVGMPSFSSGQMQIAGGGSFADGASSFGGTFGYGTPKALYGKAGIGTTSYDGFDGSSFDLSVGGGYQIPLQTSRTAELCPVASLSIGSGPNDIVGSGVDMSSRTLAFGAAVGALVGHSSQVRILPNASFQFANTRISLDDGKQSWFVVDPSRTVDFSFVQPTRGSGEFFTSFLIETQPVTFDSVAGTLTVPRNVRGVVRPSLPESGEGEVSTLLLYPYSASDVLVIPPGCWTEKVGPTTPTTAQSVE